MIKKFNKFIIEMGQLTESVHLSDDEKKFLWGKVEYKKKKKAVETENKLFDILNGDNSEIDDEDFSVILKSLEYTFRKKLSGLDKPMKLEVFKNIIEKIPSDWVHVKYSSLSAREKRKPNITWNKSDIVKYLSDNNITFDNTVTKTVLLNLIDK